MSSSQDLSPPSPMFYYITGTWHSTAYATHPDMFAYLPSNFTRFIHPKNKGEQPNQLQQVKGITAYSRVSERILFYSTILKYSTIMVYWKSESMKLHVVLIPSLKLSKFLYEITFDKKTKAFLEKKIKNSLKNSL